MSLPHCPKCNSEYTYEDNGMFICPECAHEWNDAEPAHDADALIVKDANGNLLADGDSVTVGLETLQVRHCPGHTPGHVVFYSPEAQCAFVGDVLFAGSIGRTDLPGGDLAQLKNSLRRLCEMSLGDLRVLPGHGEFTGLEREKRENRYLKADR